jgi:hypothetical protein
MFAIPTIQPPCQGDAFDRELQATTKRPEYHPHLPGIPLLLVHDASPEEATPPPKAVGAANARLPPAAHSPASLDMGRYFDQAESPTASAAGSEWLLSAVRVDCWRQGSSAADHGRAKRHGGELLGDSATPAEPATASGRHSRPREQRWGAGRSASAPRQARLPASAPRQARAVAPTRRAAAEEDQDCWSLDEERDRLMRKMQQVCYSSRGAGGRRSAAQCSAAQRSAAQRNETGETR